MIAAEWMRLVPTVVAQSDGGMTAAHWIFLVPTAIVLGVAGVFAVIKELREEGFLWQSWALRGFFLLVTAGVGFAIPKFAPAIEKTVGLDPWWSMVGAIILFLLVFCAEVFAGAVNISVIVFGAMIGILVAHLAYFILLLVMEPMMSEAGDKEALQQYALTIKMLLSVVWVGSFHSKGMTCCYTLLQNLLKKGRRPCY